MSDILASGDLEGYRPGAPPCGLGMPNIDVQVCAKATCPDCGQKGLSCRQFIRPGSYRAFAVCPGCEHAEEF